MQVGLVFLIQLSHHSQTKHRQTVIVSLPLPLLLSSTMHSGLIFLSSMASDIVSKLQSRDASHESILATVTIGLSIYTSILGCVLILVGKFHLASYCRLLPYSVVGGYLGYIGFFCGQAGLSLMAGVNVSNLLQWYKFMQIDAVMHLSPGLMGGFILYWAVRTYRHVMVLPTCVVALIGSFYAWLWMTGSSVCNATEDGWINKTANSSTSW
jgi:SulP family sulfate permease